MNKQRSSGFTIVELMIALTVGGVALASLYSVGSASVRTFREQDRVATTQSSLRAAMAQVKRDFQRAGYLATPNVDLPAERCTPLVGGQLNDRSNTLGRGRLAAISSWHANVEPPKQLDPKALNTWATVDDVILMGNYATSGEYMGVIMGPTGQTLTIPVSTQSFARDFTYWYNVSGGAAGGCNITALQAAFPVNRLLRLRTLSEQNAFATIANVTCSTATNTANITLNETVPNICSATAGWAAPVSTIRYHAVDVPAAEGTLVGDNRVVALRRTEVDPQNKDVTLTVNDGGTLRAADDRVVLDYLVRFNVQFLMRSATGINSMDYVPATEQMVRDNPERVRGVIIELAARTPEHEPNLVNLPAVRLPPFKVIDARGAARTRALRAELLLPNLVNKGY